MNDDSGSACCAPEERRRWRVERSGTIGVSRPRGRRDTVSLRSGRRARTQGGARSMHRRARERAPAARARSGPRRHTGHTALGHVLAKLAHATLRKTCCVRSHLACCARRRLLAARRAFVGAHHHPLSPPCICAGDVTAVFTAARMLSILPWGQPAQGTSRPCSRPLACCLYVPTFEALRERTQKTVACSHCDGPEVLEVCRPRSRDRTSHRTRAD